MDLGRVLDIVHDMLSAEPIILYLHGSRAYGFPSPDSDYDLRGVFLEADRNKYFSVFGDLRLEAHIEIFPYDIRLWELKKFARLIVNLNPVVYEILCLEPLYVSTRFEDEVHELLRVAKNIYHKYPKERLMIHYFGMLKSWIRYMRKEPKKSIYHVIRSFLVIAYINRHNKLPPIRLEELLESTKDQYPDIVDYGYRILGMISEGRNINVDRGVVERIRKEAAKIVGGREVAYRVEETEIINNIVSRIMFRYICGGHDD